MKNDLKKAVNHFQRAHVKMLGQKYLFLTDSTNLSFYLSTVNTNHKNAFLNKKYQNSALKKYLQKS